jgi:glutathione reductase (NADPH)
MGEPDYDLIVLGAGSGGLATAKRAAFHGGRVAIVESRRVGGTCVIRGCIPKKLMVYASQVHETLESAAGYGWRVGDVSHDWAALVNARDAAVESLERTHERLLQEAGVELKRGHGRIKRADAVEVDGEILTTRYTLIATGSAPILPRIDGIDCSITSDGVFELRERPDRVVIVGGGYIGVEFASILNGLGSDVTVVIRRDLPLRGFDSDLRRELLAAMRQTGIKVETGTTVSAIRREDGKIRVDASGPDGACRYDTDEALVYAVGRAPTTADLGLEDVGIAIGDNGEVPTLEDASTRVTGIFAVGDVTGRAALTPVAIQAGRLLADRLFAGSSARMSYENIPTAVFTAPPIGTVGLTEDEAVARYGADNVSVYRSRFNPLFHMLTEQKIATLVKLIVVKTSDVVVGCHIIGHDAPEIIQGFGVAVRAGLTKRAFDETVGIHPSTAEEFVTLT